MTLEEIYYIGQTFAVVAIIGSLIALIVQMRQANRLARAAAVRGQIESLQYIAQAMYQTPRLTEILVKGNSGLGLSQVESIKATAYLTDVERTWEALYDAYRHGLVDPELWEAHRKQARALASAPLSRAVWALRKDLFTKAYQTFRDADCTPTTGDYPHKYYLPSVDAR